MANSRSLRRRLARAAVGASVIAAASSASDVQVAEATSESMTHNICGNVCGIAGSHNLGKTKPVKDLIAYMNLTPLSLGLNEVCGSWNDANNQAGHVKDFLYNRNNLYLGRSRAQLVAGNYCNSTGVTFGIAQYVLSSNREPNVDSGPFTRAPGDAENRGWLCINGGVNSPKYWGCTAHMNNTNPGSSVTGAPAEIQFAQYYCQAKARAGKPIYWGGDLYVYVNEIPNIPTNCGSFSFSTSQESDLCYNGTYNWTHRHKTNFTLSKFDYTFRSGPNRKACPADGFRFPGTTGEMYPSGTFPSDHRIVIGDQPF